MYKRQHSDGEKGDALTCDMGAFMKMDGQEVFKFAVRQVPAGISEVLQKNGLSVDDIDYFILHQANRRIVEAVAKRMKVEIEKFPMNLQEYGNTSSASIPLLLDELNRQGKLKKGQKLIFAGFGEMCIRDRKNTMIFKRLLGYLKAYRMRLFFVLVSAVISTAFMVLAPFLVGKVTTTL